VPFGSATNRSAVSDAGSNTPREPYARDVKLTRNARRNRLKPSVQNVNPIVGQRTANRNISLSCVILSQTMCRRPNAALRRAILIDQGDAGETLMMPIQEFMSSRLRLDESRPVNSTAAIFRVDQAPYSDGTARNSSHVLRDS
jgi:hypothetical protein